MKKIISILFAAIMLLSAISCLTVGALGNSTDDEADITIEAGSYEPGSVVVSLIKGAPSVEELLVGFDIVETRVIIDRSDQSTCYYVKFSEETEEIVLEAIAVLSENPYVKYAEPNYYAYIDPEVPSTEPETTPEITEPETTAPATKPVTEPSTQQASSSTSDTATTDTVLIKNSNGTVQTGQNNFMLISALMLIVSVGAAAVYVKFN